MGNDIKSQKSKILSKSPNGEKKKFKLSESSFAYLCNQTNQSRFVIEEMVNNFFEENSKDFLDKKDFVRLYCSLRAEPEEKLSKIADYVFKAFDRNKDGLEYIYSLTYIPYTLDRLQGSNNGIAYKYLCKNGRFDFIF